MATLTGYGTGDGNGGGNGGDGYGYGGNGNGYGYGGNGYGDGNGKGNNPEELRYLLLPSHLGLPVCMQSLVEFVNSTTGATPWLP